MSGAGHSILFRWRQNSSRARTVSRLGILLLLAWLATAFDVAGQNLPHITQQPANLTVTPGSTAIFRVVAAGDEPLSYQWYFDLFTAIPDGTNATLVLTNVQLTNAGSYQVVITNALGVVNSSEARLTVKHPPAVVEQPASLVVTQGHTATFLVGVTGDGPWRCQWYFNATNAIFGATNFSLLLTDVEPAQAGSYMLHLTNDVGFAVSAEAILEVRVPPAIVGQPGSRVVVAGNPAAFTVNAIGDAPLSYQWFFNGTNALPNATAATLQFPAVTSADAGVYSVVVSNPVGVTNSNPAVLTVHTIPEILQQPASLAVTQGNAASFTATASGIPAPALQWYFNATNLIAGATGPTFSLASAQFFHAGTYSVSASNAAGLIVSSAAQLAVRVPPALLQQPVSRIIAPGSSATFSVLALGDAPLRYQWFFNATNPLAQATNATLLIPNVQAALAGQYSARVSNDVGSVTSQTATLTIKQPPVILQQPVSLVVTAGAPATFSVTAGGDGPIGYRWVFDQTNLVATTPSFTIANAQLAHVGIYSVLVTNDAGSVLSSLVSLNVRTPPAITQQPAHTAVAPGATATFSVVASGAQPLRYQWYLNGTTIVAGATNATLTVTNAAPGPDTAYSVSVANDIGTVTSASALLRVRQTISIVQPPVSQTVTQGHAATFTTLLAGDSPFTYQWYFNGTNALANGRNPSLVLSNVQPADAGSYSVRVTNLVSSAASSEATLTVRLIPTIVQQPAAQTRAPGSEVTFSVVASGETPFSYQWFFDGTPLAEQTNQTLVRTSLQFSDTGNYSVQVSNVVGVTTSANARLTVLVPPTIVSAPSSLVCTQGWPASLAVVAGGDGPLSYQWFFNGVTPVASATNATLLLPSVQPQQAGVYSVQVSNAVGSVLSDAATLTINLWPVISQSPASVVVTQAQAVTLTVSAVSETPMTHQWRRNGSALPDATSSTLVWTNVQPANAGSYDVIVANEFGSATSALATVTVYGLDFGDAPDPGYPTYLVNDGARHVIVPGLFLGIMADPEPDGQPTFTASADDLAVGTNEIENGIRFVSPLRAGQLATLEVMASAVGRLSAWIDLDHTNGWSQPGEQVLTNRTLAAGTNLVTVRIPNASLSGQTFARFRFSSASDLAPGGFAPDGEVEDYALTILPATDLTVAQTVTAATVTAGNNATFTLNVTNRGPSAATGVTLVERLSSRSTFVSATPSQGACGHTNGVVTCNVGDLATGARATVTLVARIGAGTNVQQATVSGAEFDPDTANNQVTAATTGILSLPAGSNTDPIILPVDDPGPGDLYPSQITVSGATSSVFKITVTVRDINHSFPDDLDILLVGPRGQKVLLMSDAGLDNAMTDVSVTFDDDATPSLPDSDPQIVTGTYKPTNFGSTSDEFESPAPPAPYVTNLTTFRGTDPNGTWSLYVRDDQPLNANPQGGDPGFIALGWTLSITTGDPMADLFLTQSAQPNPVIVGNSLTCTINVTNRGPAISSAIVNDPLPPGVNFVSVTTTRGACAANASVVSCDLGSLASGAGARIVLELAPTLGGPITNTVTVTGNQLELVPADNTASVVTTVLPVADLRLSAAAPGSGLLGQPVTQTLNVTNLGPNVATAVVLTNVLASGSTFVSANASQGTCTHQNGIVTCQLGDLPAAGLATLQIVATANTLGVNSNFTSVGSAPLDFTPANNLAATLTTVNPAADIALNAVTPSGRILAGRDFVTTITVSNRGPSTADVQLVDPLPTLVTFASANSTLGSCSVVAGTVRCDLNGLAPGQSAVIVVTAHTATAGTLTNIITAIGSVGDVAPGNNSATNIVMIVPATDLAMSIADRPDPLWLGENLVYSLAITNQGPYPVTSVLLTNLLPSGVTYLTTTWSQGVCSRLGDEVSCNLGALAIGATASISITVRPTSPGLLFNAVQLFAELPDSNPANNLLTASTRVVTSSGSFASSPITIPRVGTANPYPATINVSGLTASVFQVRVVLTNLSHSYADDVDVLLVAPDGRAALLMSDAGGESDLQNITLTLDDQAAQALPDLGILGSGLYRPANFELAPDDFPSPAPAPPYGSALSTFVGMDPNGPWSLYVVDDADKDAGSLGGWRLIFSTLEPIADLQLTQQLSANPAAVSSNLVFSYSVTNRGPANAIDVRLTNNLPVQLQGVTFSTSQGACSLAGGSVFCALGNIPTGGSVNVSVFGSALTTGNSPNVVTVASALVDLQPANNTLTTVVIFENPPIITLQPISQVVTNGSGAVFATAAIGDPPLFYQWQRNGVNLAGATNAALEFPSVTSFNSGAYRVRVSNRVGVAVSDTANLTVVGPPTISDLPDVVIAEDTATGLIPFTVVDFESPAESLQVFGDSSDHTIVPPNAIVFSGTGSERTVRVTPLPDRTGTVTIAVAARDPDDRVSTNFFLLTITEINDLPSMSDIPDQFAAEDVPLPVPFTVADIETAPDLLLYSIVSSNPALVSSTNVTFSGTGTNRIATITPLLNQFGTAHLTLTVTDASGVTVSDSFELNVAPVNDPPTVDFVEDLTINEDSGARTVNLTGITSGAPDEIQNLIVTAHSSQPAIIPNPVVSYLSPASTGTITFAPLTNASGPVVLTVTVSDGHPTNAIFNRSFTVNVLPVNDPPTLANIPDQSTLEDTSLHVAVAISDLDTNAAALNLTATSSLQSLIPNANLLFGGTGLNRSLTLTPATNAAGTATITVTVTDPSGAVATDTFVLTVTAVNDPPTLNELTDRTVGEDAPAQDVVLSGIGAGAVNENQTLTFSASSSNPALIPTPIVRYTNGNSTGVLTFRPATNATGTATLTVTADDGQAANRSTSRSFVVTVSGTNDVPAIPAIGDQSTPEDVPLTVPFTISDPETGFLNLSLTATSANTNLIATTNIVFSGSGTDRTVTLVPTTNQFGTSLITLHLTDGVQTNTESFTLTVTPVNDPPTLNPIAHFQTNSASGNPVYTVALSGISDGATNESQNVTFSAVSTNTALLPNPTIAYNNPDTTATLTLRPANNSGGVSLVTVTANDNGGGNSTFSQSFLVFIKSSANTLPTVSVINAQTMGEDTTSPALSFNVRDAETPVGSVTVLARSSNQQLLPDANIIITGSTTTNRSVTLTPALNQTGTVAVTLTAVDAAFGSSNMTFNVTVTNINDAPTISGIAAQTVAESSPTALLPFTINDVETRPGNLVVTATSANQALVPDANILVGGAGANRGIIVTPAPGQSGTASITLRVSDGAASNSTSFVLTVNATNQPPSLTPIANVSTAEDVTATSAPFTIGDRETPLGALSLAAASTNPSLIPTAGISFGGTGADRTVILAPQPNVSGTALITVTLTDGSNATTTREFTFTVRSVNDAPTLDSIAGILINENAGAQSIALTGIGSGAANESQSLTVTATSTNADLVASVAVDYTTPGSTGTLTFRPVPNTNGVAVIAVTVNDGQDTNGLVTRELVVTINAIPTVAYVPDQKTLEDTVTAPIAITLLDRDTPADQLTVIGTSSNPALVPDANVVVQGTGASRTVTVTPATNQFGLVQIHLSVTDTNGASSTNHFFLTIEPVVDAITISSPPQSFSALVGTTAHFSVTATSALPLTYQWQRDGSDLTGATGSELNLAAVQLADTGDFRVIISNADTSVTSPSAQLQVVAAPGNPTIVAITQADGVVNISFASTAGVTYTLEYKDTLADPQWISAGSTPGTGTIAVLTDSDQNRPTRFYRVRAN